MEGDVYSSEHIELAAKARVIGNVYYHLIEMVMGSEVNGSLYHRTPVELKPKQIDMQQNVKQSPGAGIEAVVVKAAKASSQYLTNLLGYCHNNWVLCNHLSTIC